MRWFLGWLPDNILKKIAKSEEATYDEDDVVEDGDDNAVNGGSDDEEADNDKSAY